MLQYARIPVRELGHEQETKMGKGLSHGCLWSESGFASKVDETELFRSIISGLEVRGDCSVLSAVSSFQGKYCLCLKPGKPLQLRAGHNRKAAPPIMRVWIGCCSEFRGNSFLNHFKITRITPPPKKRRQRPISSDVLFQKTLDKISSDRRRVWKWWTQKGMFGCCSNTVASYRVHGGFSVLDG